MLILYFAQAADATGCRSEEWDITDPIALDDFWAEAIHRHPGLAQIKTNCRVASGLRYVNDGEFLDPSVETAVLPPVSGG